MKDGYYLFIYSQIEKIYNVSGLPCRHDQNMAVFLKNNHNIKLICHLELERFSGIKHHNIAFYGQKDCYEYLNELLGMYDLNLDDFVGVYGTPGLIEGDTDISFTSILDVKDISYHAISHLYSSLLMDSQKYYNNTILALAFDGGSDHVLDKKVDTKFLFCGAVAKKGNIEYFPIASPGAYWLYLSDYFKKTEGALMALAYATKTTSLEQFEDLPDYRKVSDRTAMIVAINKIIDRIMGYTLNDENVLYVDYDERFSEEECKLSMIMKVIQELSVKKVFQQIDLILNHYRLRPEETIIALAGGYALNCPTNTQIMHKYHFKEQQCVPCVNDGGLSVGMGLYFFNKKCKYFEYRFETPFYGFSDEKNIDKTLEEYHFFIENIERDAATTRAALDIEKEPIIWIDGKAESGPRALGHRSILGNPLKSNHKDFLNQYKQREWWRPVAPIILEEKMQEWFIDAFESPYMLNNFKIKPKLAQKVPAILHLDESARVQTLRKEDNYRLYAVISDFEKITGVPMVCNTSLNDKGEPIINTIEQAINFALRKNIRIIYAYGIRICLKNHEQYTEKKFLKRNDDVFMKYKGELKTLFTEINPYDLSILDFLIYLYNPSLHSFNLSIEKDVKQLKMICSHIRRISKNLQMFTYLEKVLREKMLD